MWKIKLNLKKLSKNATFQKSFFVQVNSYKEINGKNTIEAILEPLKHFSGYRFCEFTLKSLIPLSTE